MAARSRRLALALAVLGAAAAVVAAPARPADFRSVANGACVRYDRATSALVEVTSAAEMKRQAVLGTKIFRTMVDAIAAAAGATRPGRPSGRVVAAGATDASPPPPTCAAPCPSGSSCQPCPTVSGGGICCLDIFPVVNGKSQCCPG